MRYVGRPGASPVIAALFAAGSVQRSHAVLDIGCGDGTDVLALGAWGVREVCGLDMDEDALARADKRASARGLENVSFHKGSVTRPHDCFPDGAFDVVFDSLCLNNLEPQARPGYVRQLWRVLKPGGIWVLQARYDGPVAARGRDFLPPSFHRHFVLGQAVSTQLPERALRNKRTWATVMVCIGTRRGRPLRASG
jgi:ubiquinone/menaquinone biosynthesis C-methylase UbiE